ncbi:DUF5687 family protein [Muricauda sp. SCSIO 64092]|uniref:DUF5687 family protein n=1 Tax=Allomuricauda sp. SCSIO 64092 TaxID=2908842 RepID=UPI001FF617EC|nr:DUF5687 family protein [Muricauda sp. SCSIO 64092]UOY08809.1 DUF5687 family protein [Muricauda sp. SCSIO 64092]
MFKRFIQLQWKAFFRSASFGKSVGIKIFMAFMGLYLLASLGILGGTLYFILRKLVPDQGPMWVLSQFLVYWVLAELFFRYFMQKLPVMEIKPLLINNIPKSKIVNYILGKSVFSGFNLLTLVTFVPFAIVLLAKGYPALNVLVWLLAMTVIALCANFLNFLINKSDVALGIIIGALVAFWGLEYFGIISIKAIFGSIFHALYAYPISVLAPLGILVVLYFLNFKYLQRVLYLDGALKGKTKEAKSTNLAWTRRFGEMAPFLQLDLRLIWRNKRTKTQVWISLLFVFYGLIFYTQEVYANMVGMHVFLGIFMTGIFLANFGQFIPAWDSAYYGMMMSQNIPLRKYLESKALLITVSVVVMFFLTIPYVYFGWKVFLVNTACAVYNLGINIPVILYFGSFNKKRIELDQSPFGNMQGTSAVQFLIMLPVLGLPIALFTLLHFLISFEIAISVLVGLGILGYAFKGRLLDLVTEQYAHKKHAMLQGFQQKNG